jgi:hypothetical protein
MTHKLIITALLLLLSGAADGVRDTISFHYNQTGLSKDNLFWNPDISWRNKWKDGDKEQGERFPGSSTVFVWATDAWHLFQTIMLALFRVAMLMVASMFIRLKWWAWGLWFIAISAVWSSGFHLVYTLIF